MQRRLALPYEETLAVVQEISNLARSVKHQATAGLAMMLFVDEKTARECYGFDSPLLVMRAQGPLSILQLSISCAEINMQDGWKAAIDPYKLLGALKYIKRTKPKDVQINVLKTGIKIGKITIRTEDAQVFKNPPPGVTDAKVVSTTPNPYTAVLRIGHCAGDDSIPSVAILSGQILAARRSQAIVVDCEIFPATDKRKVMVPVKELLRVKALDDTLQVRLSEEYLVFRGEANLLAINIQRWSRTMDEALAFFGNASFVDQVSVNRLSLFESLKAAKSILGSEADAELSFADNEGLLRSTEEGNEGSFTFECAVKSKKKYSLGLVVRMLLDAITYAPEPDIVFKIPDLSAGPVNMIHLVDSESHEVIGLGMTGQLRDENAGA